MTDTMQVENPHASACNPYEPKLAVVEKIIEESWDTKTFRAVFQDEEVRESFTYEPGQFQEVGVFGVGEATFCLTSTPTRKGYIEFAVKKFGSVTTALHDLDEGAIVGIRGPLGNWFPYHEWKGKNLLFVGGGIGMAPMRSLLNFCLDQQPTTAASQLSTALARPATSASNTSSRTGTPAASSISRSTRAMRPGPATSATCRVISANSRPVPRTPSPSRVARRS